MKFIATLAAAAAFALPASAMAQDAHAGHEGHAEQAAAVEVTDEEIAMFADIVVQGQGIQNNTEMNDQQKEAAMLGVISQSGMGLERFSVVAQAIGQDEALQQRMQAAVMQRIATAS